MYGYEAKRLDCDSEIFQVEKEGHNIGKILVINRENGSKEIHYLIPDFMNLPIEQRLYLRSLIEEE